MRIRYLAPKSHQGNGSRSFGACALASDAVNRSAGSKKPWWLGDGMPQEGAATPKIACAIDFGGRRYADEAIRSVVQIGVITSYPAARIPWTVSSFNRS
jgi:hypothetical protein